MNNNDDNYHTLLIEAGFYMYVHVHTCMSSIYVTMGVETLSRLPDILVYFHHSCPAPHILVICIQFSLNLLDIYTMY